FSRVSALLAEATNNSAYLDAAKKSAAFIQTHLYNANGLVLEIMSASQNDSCKTIDDSVDSFNSGLFIEGLAVLVSLTSDVPTQTL
ncbi:hypothetical protein B0H19DRAFT_969317, partial [Mycena capillaripes]